MISKAILEGKHDAELDAIADAVHQRRRYLANINAQDLKAGDTVKFVSTVRPKYLAGVEGKIIEKRTKKFVVRVPQHLAGRFMGGTIVCPASLLQKVA